MEQKMLDPGGNGGLEMQNNTQLQMTSPADEVMTRDLEMGSVKDESEFKLGADVPEVRWTPRKILKNVVVLSVSFVFLFTAFKSLVNLQTSLNREHGVGAYSLSAIYAALIVSCIFLPKFIIARLGCKWTIPLCMTGYALYMAANLHATVWLMILAGAILGLGAASLWAAQGTYLTQLGIWYSRICLQSEAAVIHKFFGFFFMMFHSSQIWGNLISSMVLEKKPASNVTSTTVCGASFRPQEDGNSTTFRQPLQLVHKLCIIYIMCAVVAIVIVSLLLDPITLDQETSVVEDHRKLTTMEDHKMTSEEDNELTSVEDCKLTSVRDRQLMSAEERGLTFVEDHRVTSEENLTITSVDNYRNLTKLEDRDMVPPEDNPMLTSVVNQSKLTSVDHRKLTSVEDCSMTSSDDREATSLEDLKLTSAEGSMLTSVEENRKLTSVDHRPTSAHNHRKMSSGKDRTLTSTEDGKLLSVKDRKVTSAEDRQVSPQLLVATVRHLVSSPAQMLLVPLSVYSGAEQAFFSGDYTQSYVSCTLGVANVGYVLICFGVMNAVCSFLFGRLVQCLGHAPFFGLAFLVHGALQITLLLWTPDPEQAVYYYLVAGFWGMGDAVIVAQINALYGALFTENPEAAFANHRLWESAGYVMTFTYQNSLKTAVKLYVNLAFLTIGMMGYAAVEVLERRKWSDQGRTAVKGKH